jgi:hypothetical protein
LRFEPQIISRGRALSSRRVKKFLWRKQRAESFRNTINCKARGKIVRVCT